MVSHSEGGGRGMGGAPHPMIFSEILSIKADAGIPLLKNEAPH